MSANRTFDSVLIANRGEIACRVIRTVKALGYRSIAVYSNADASAQHVRLADTAVAIGASPISESYANIEHIISAAQQSGAQAIHPGYGFLSENAEFAERCEQSGLILVGPSSQAIRLMGNKAAAKQRMLSADVPCVPGYQGQDQSDAILIEAANKIGLPVMVKAAAGGGGRGLRWVDNETELPAAIEIARSEAQNAFGSSELIIEKAVLKPRHVEIQVFADTHGNTIHLGERDCSVQRRHQKVIEESPCPVMTTEQREAMGAAAVTAAKSIDYVGAGTVEFLLDQGGDFYFLEMNTRLQVEHPVTEMVTGLDLVALQLQVAQGEPLTLTQDDISLRGHAIEVRLYAEDPNNEFLPTTGKITHWQAPNGDGVRVDAGIQSGDEISPYYDSMVAKVIAWGEDREQARHRLRAALQKTMLFGIRHNAYFLDACLAKTAFVAGLATTAFIEDEFDESALTPRAPTFEESAMAATIDIERSFQQRQRTVLSPVSELKNWCSAGELIARKRYVWSDSPVNLTISCHPDYYRVADRGNNQSCLLRVALLENSHATIEIDGNPRQVTFNWSKPGQVEISSNGFQSMFIDLCGQIKNDNQTQGSGLVVAPMHGKVVELPVQEGQQVSRGDTVAILEAMKMQHQIQADVEGKVESIVATVNSQVAAGDPILQIQETSDPS